MNAQRRAVYILWILSAAFAAIAIAGLLGLDAIAAGTTARSPTFWNGAVGLLDLIALKEISNFLLGVLLLAAAGLLLAILRLRRVGWIALYVGLVQFLATTIADLSKPQFGRLRPWEAAGVGGTDSWFVAANSFPSGHTAFYAGLFLPLILLVPRLTPLWLVPPLFVAVSRVVVGDHYLSDVAVSLALAAALAAALAPLAARGGATTLASA